MSQKVTAQILGFFCCVGLPAFISAIAPVSVVHLVRENERVTADLTTRIFYAFPYRHAIVQDVKSVDDRFHEGERIRGRNGEPNHNAEDESFLVLHGASDAAEVPVSPINIQAAVAKVATFLSQPTPREQRITVVANWKFGVFLPLLLSPLAILYLVGLVLTVFRWIVRLNRPARH